MRLLENRFAECGGLTVAGIGDRWSGRERTHYLHAYHAARPLVGLSHNPDTALDLNVPRMKLLLAGHTHGGQIRIPWLYKKVIPVRGPFDVGLHVPVTATAPRVFVTSGLGETALPLRLFRPPVVDVLVFE